MVVVTAGNESYYMNKYVKEMWDLIKDGKLKQQDDDRVFIVDGKTGTGKSVFALQQAAYIDPSILTDFSRICFSSVEFIAAIRNTKSTETETKVIIFDEAFRGMSSRSITDSG